MSPPRGVQAAGTYRPGHVPAGVSAIAEGVASGELTEAGELSKVIDAFRSAVEAVSFEARLAALGGKVP
jgi:hypothetical protein